jgi:multiple sugar transport system permease protein
MATITRATAAPRERAVTKERAEIGVWGPKLLGTILVYALMIFVALIFLLPLIWMVSTSLKPQAEWFTRDLQWIPQNPTFRNYEELFNNTRAPIGRWFVNSIAISVITSVLVLAVDALAAYAYARMDFPGRKLLFGVMLLTLFLPGFMFIVPNFLTIHALNLSDSWGGVIAPWLAGVFGVFFLRQFFESIPKELEEAAAIDGANRFQIFFRVVLPLARPALATLGIITFLGSWNDFLWPYLLLADNLDLQTLPLGLRSLQSTNTSDYGMIMAGAVIVAIPVLLIYLILQRYVVQSVASTGLKG